MAPLNSVVALRFFSLLLTLFPSYERCKGGKVTGISTVVDALSQSLKLKR